MDQAKAGQIFSTREIFSLLASDLVEVEKEIGLESVASVEAVTAIAQYLQSSGGKRLRPSLLLLCARLFDRQTDSTPAAEGGRGAIRLAAVVEILHAATLVHDDVIDMAQTRRGRPSANVQWGNHTCVLAGDWLYMQAFQIALRERNFHILDLLIGLTQLMVEGELIQLERIGKIEITEADCMEIVDRKTAGLFSVCAKLGAVMGGADTAVEERLGEYAWNLGMAFQLIDDLLDFTSREKTLGKPVGNDLREGKITLPMVYTLEQASLEERRQIELILREQNYDAVPFSQVRAMLSKYGAIGRVQERAQQFTDKARQIIAEFPDSPYQSALASIADLITARDH
jgi:octaprenyl-diphosphate synthase